MKIEVSDKYMHEIHDDLTDGFIRYQWRLDNPFPQPDESMDKMISAYRNDYIFNAKVKSIVGSIMLILNKHIG